MANPNLKSLTNVKAVTAVLNDVPTTMSDVLHNNSTTTPNHLFKVNAVIASNLTTSNRSVTLVLDRSGTETSIITEVQVPGGGSLDLIPTHIYLNEGDKLRALADVASSIDILVTYEDMD